MAKALLVQLVTGLLVVGSKPAPDGVILYHSFHLTLRDDKKVEIKQKYLLLSKINHFICLV